MAMGDPSVTKMVQTLVNGGRDSVTRIGTAPVVALRKATVVSVNGLNRWCTLTLGGSAIESPQVRISPDCGIPAVGDLVWVQLNGAERGASMMVVSRQPSANPTWP